MRIGLLGGTFDPIHNAHLFIAEDVAARFRLDHLRIIPNGSPPHKQDSPTTPAHHRLRMARLAAAEASNVDADGIEVERPGPSYTVDTLRELTSAHPNAELVFITGIDAIAEIQTWKEPYEVLNLCTMVAVHRPGFPVDILDAALPEPLRRRIIIHDIPEIGISSTMIRNRVASGLPIRHLTPDSVVEYILRHGLYTDRRTP